MKLPCLPDLVAARTQAGSKPKPDSVALSDAWQREMEKAQMAMWLDHQPLGSGTHGVENSLRPAAQSEMAGVEASTRGAVDRSLRHTAAQAVRETPKDLLNSEGIEQQSGRLAPARVSLSGPSIEPLVGTASAQVVLLHTTPLPPHWNLLSEVGAVVSSAASCQIEIFTCSWPLLELASLPVAAPTRANELANNKPATAAADARSVPSSPGNEVHAEAMRLHCQFTEDGLMVWIGANPNHAFNVEAVAAQLHQILARQALKLLSLTYNGRVVTAESEAEKDMFTNESREESTWPLDR